MAERRRPPPEPTDEALAARVAAGDLDAFSQLYDRYERPVFSMAAHLLGAEEAEEVVQESFLRFWRSADQFDVTRGRLGPWFFTIARNEVMARLRRRNRDQRLVLAEDIHCLLGAARDVTVDVEEEVWQRERGEIVLQALKVLPPEQRRVLVLAYFGDLSQSMIASSLGWPLGTVKKRTRLGLQKLRQALGPRDVTGDAAGDNGSNAPDGRRSLARRRTQVSVDDGP